MRAIAVTHVPEQRQGHREQDPLLNAERDHGRRGGDREIKLAGAFAAYVAQAFQVDHAERNVEDNCRQHAARQQLSGPLNASSTSSTTPANANCAI